MKKLLESETALLRICKEHIFPDVDILTSRIIVIHFEHSLDENEQIRTTCTEMKVAGVSDKSDLDFLDEILKNQRDFLLKSGSN